MPFVDNMEITHRPGKSIPHVDCLSRNVSSGTSQPHSAGGTVPRPLASQVVEIEDQKVKIGDKEEDGKG
jgi:hypothetical protein